MAVEFPRGWLQLAGDRQEILLLVGPITVAGEAESLPADLPPRRICRMLEYGSLIAADAVVVAVAVG
ncbi:hypothetical protein [Nonomuraea sp. NPDC049709]|uniref:hypothetical protein n=1 Tax=Nonomuraea sp. NPDC049709 TaxID=3154736 RepID=UPI00343A50C6